jgi:hypothetical protein
MTRVREWQGSLKALTTTIQSPSENLQGTPTTLPTSEPGTPQISYTVASGDLPTFSMGHYSQVWIAVLVAAGKAVTAATINWRMKKNGSSVNTNSFSVAANTYYTINAFFYDISVGDVLAIALWSNKTDSNWDYNAYQVRPTRIILKSTLPVYVPFNIVTMVTHPTLVQGNPGVQAAYGMYLYHEDSFTLYKNTSAAVTFASLHPAGTYGFFRCYALGDMGNPNNAATSTSATYRPYYQTEYIPVVVTMRELRF